MLVENWVDSNQTSTQRCSTCLETKSLNNFYKKIKLDLMDMELFVKNALFQNENQLIDIVRNVENGKELIITMDVV